MASRTSGKKKPPPKVYVHKGAEDTILPSAGAQDSLPPGKIKPPKTYRYDSSLAPEMRWDEGEAREHGEEAVAAILGAKTLEEAQRAAQELRNMSKPFLNWAGKAERGAFTVPSLPLFVHERLAAKAVLDTLKRRQRNRQETLELFNEGNATVGEKIRGAYRHKNGWRNRMILGDSLQVMHSLLTYEGKGGDAQMIYMDPPYGIKFGSNFQPFIKRRDVKDGDDDHLTREPEMVNAYRDTWTLGTHSWLTYMRDRLLLARELLADSGSCFVQISDENVHFVRCVMDEVFGQENFVSMITYKTTGGMSQALSVKRTADYILWYAKDSERMKFNRLFKENILDTGMFSRLENGNGERRAMTREERDNPEEIAPDLRAYTTLPMHSKSGNDDSKREFAGKKWGIPSGSWRYSLEGFNRLAKAGRIVAEKTALRAIYYFDDFGYTEYTNNWTDTGPEISKDYIVQTSTRVIQRCMLMTTDPGDLVIDPTCGSGTTALVAEQWGRRWITMDVSRVPLALARQRLLTATYPYYCLKNEETGPSAGFVYERKQNKKGEEVGGIVPHITLRSIANNEPPKEEVLVDKPESETNTVRITGPFSVEAVIPSAASAEDDSPPSPEEMTDGAESHITRMIEVMRLAPQVRMPGNKTITLADVRACAKSANLHAEAKMGDERVAVYFGPANAVVGDSAVVEAGREAKRKDYAKLLVAAFAIEPQARKSIEEGEETFGIPALYAQVSMDVVMGELLKNMRSSQIFAVSGLPDVELLRLKEKSEDGLPLYRARLRGVDIFDPTTMQERGKDSAEVPCWMLDTDYDLHCFRAGQVFFPKTGAWDNVKKAVGAEFDESAWSHLSGDTSEPFVGGGEKRVAIKVIDERGNELIVVKSLSEAGEE